jgi:hypothetical protein
MGHLRGETAISLHISVIGKPCIYGDPHLHCAAQNYVKASLFFSPAL